MRPNWLIPLELACLVAMSIWILLEKRPPLATLLWLALVALLPIGGFGILLLLGPRRVQRRQRRRATEQAALGAVDADARRSFDSVAATSTLELRFQQLVAQGQRNAQASVTSGNRVEVLRNGAECFPAIEQAIAAAKQHVHLEYYTFEGDRTGTRLRDLLIERAHAGVRVRLLVDAFGSGLSRRFLRPLREVGAEIEPFNRMRLGRMSSPSANFRSHRKIVVCDGDVAFTGGLNVGDLYAGVDPAHPTRDTHVRIEGPAAAALQRLFVEDWYSATRRVLREPHLFGSGSSAGAELVEILASGADHRWHALEQLYFTAITSAERRVRITTPYFVPDQALRMALVSAALRGVSVEVLVPRQSDSRIVAAAGRSFYDELLSAGVRIYEYGSGFLHAKSLVVDGRCATVGTANLNRRSFNTDFEVNAVFFSRAIAAQLDTMFEDDLAAARECTLEGRRRLSFGQRLVEAGAHLLAPIL